jgi:hypothetical protein
MDAEDRNRLAMEPAVVERRAERADDPVVGIIGDFEDRAVLVSPPAFPRHAFLRFA